MQTTLSSAKRGLAVAGSVSKTSSAAPATWPDLQGFGEGGFVDEAAAGAVDDADAAFAGGDGVAGEDVAGGVRQWGVEGDDVGAGEEFGEFDFLHAEVDGAFFREEGVVGDDAHVEADGAVGDDCADVAAADEAEGFCGQLHAHEAVLFPLAGAGAGGGFGDLPGQGEHHGDGVLGCCDGVAEGGVHDHDAAGGGAFDVDVVDADAGAADDAEAGGGVQQFLRDLGCGADREAVVVGDDGAEFCW